MRAALSSQRIAQALAALAFVLAGLMPVHSPDTYGHLAQGRQIAELGRVPSHDTFSFFRETPVVWHNYEWLSDLLTHQMYALGGADALIAVKCLLLALTAVLLVAFAARLGGDRAALLASALLAFTTFVMRFRFTERPHVIGFVLLAAYAHAMLSLVTADTRRARALTVGLFAAHVFWVNVHGSHLLGLLLVGACLLGAWTDAPLRKRMATALVALLLASCVSPYGPYILVDAVEHVLQPGYRSLVSEWQPWQPDDPIAYLAVPVLATLLLVTRLGPIARAHRLAPALLGVALVLAVATSRSIRFIAEYLLLACPLLGVGLATWLRGVPARRFAYASAGLFVLAAVSVPKLAEGLPPLLGMGRGEARERMPVGAGEWLREHAVAPRVMSAMEDGWYLLFAVPQARVLLDGRAPFYGPAHVRAVSVALSNADALESMMTKHRVDTVVVRHALGAQRAALAAMLGRSDFVLVDVEDKYATFVSRDLPLRSGVALEGLRLLPSYSADWLLSASDVQGEAIRAELSRLPDDSAHAGYRGFVQSMLSLRGLLRAGPADGLREPRNPHERVVLREASRGLERASHGSDGVPAVEAYRALALIALCDLDAADAALYAATRDGESRESLLGRMEWLLRRGETERVAALLRESERDPRAQGDAWLAALRAALKQPPRCPS